MKFSLSVFILAFFTCFKDSSKIQNDDKVYVLNELSALVLSIERVLLNKQITLKLKRFQKGNNVP